MFDQAKLVKQAWDMKKQMERVQKELEHSEIVVKLGSVTVTITGTQVINQIKLDPTVQEMENIQELEKAIKQAMNKAISDSQDVAKKELQKVTGGLNIPGLT
ncbi:nucleoid-associated protein, YbaB/EbfC family [Candidatus Wirthbacteria bacterium CG2_30_54_11]|uniref:Nucleoid-associated protein, YbaB/EbfC family n=1 Tax=Candidatus Wirthbacteria bacterium CG2_30_54_11 TaxID=1817892 RepID=A0A1J5IPS5_9BACT|nr:MAG: nucleoid-associated protein, YbaB/EbfC family [Candidatus Wirthbacteria bacterium CG2_30_54_11]